MQWKGRKIEANGQCQAILKERKNAKRKIIATVEMAMLYTGNAKKQMKRVRKRWNQERNKYQCMN